VPGDKSPGSALARLSRPPCAERAPQIRALPRYSPAHHAVISREHWSRASAEPSDLSPGPFDKTALLPIHFHCLKTRGAPRIQALSPYSPANHVVISRGDWSRASAEPSDLSPGPFDKRAPLRGSGHHLTISGIPTAALPARYPVAHAH